MKMFIASPIAVYLLLGKFANEKRYLEAPSCVCRVVLCLCLCAGENRLLFPKIKLQGRVASSSRSPAPDARLRLYASPLRVLALNSGKKQVDTVVTATRH